MGNREEFEKCMVAFDPDQSLTLAAEYPHYASYVTSMAANMFESRQPEIDALKAEILQKSLEGWTEIQRLKAEVERLRGLSHDLPPLCEIERLQRNAAGPTPPAQYPYEAACSGMRYPIPEACGNVAAIHIDGNRWPVAMDGWRDAMAEAAEVVEQYAPGFSLLIERMEKILDATTPPAPAQSRESLIYDLTAPVITPPAPEVEPVYQVMRKEKWDWDTVSSDEYEKLKGMKMRDRRILYTHPTNDGLRKAAEEAQEWLMALAEVETSGVDPQTKEDIRACAKNLRAELNKDKSC